MPTPATFPEIDMNEEFYCNFKAIASNYSFTLPFVNGKFCDDFNTSIPDFGLQTIRKLI